MCCEERRVHVCTYAYLNLTTRAEIPAWSHPRGAGGRRESRWRANGLELNRWPPPEGAHAWATLNSNYAVVQALFLRLGVLIDGLFQRQTGCHGAVQVSIYIIYTHNNVFFENCCFFIL